MKRELRRTGRWLRTAGALAALAVFAPEARAQSPTLFSPDITADLGGGGATIADDDAATDDAAGTITPVLLTMLGAAIPSNAGIADFELSTTLPPVLALDITATLPGLAAPAEPRDVVAWNPNTSTFSLVFDGSAEGVPENAHIDAVSYNTAGQLVLSFDTTVALPGGVTAEDEDLVAWSPGPFYTLIFDGSANGVPPGLDLDAASRLNFTSDMLLLSFDGSGIIAGIPFDDEDTLVFDPGGATWALFNDASLSDPVNYPPVDVVALPEPGSDLSLLAGAGLLAALAHRARRSQPEASKEADSRAGRRAARRSRAKAGSPSASE